MLMAGYRRVIATMWAVNDSDAPIIAETVYKYMLSDGKADGVRLANSLVRESRVCVCKIFCIRKEGYHPL